MLEHLQIEKLLKDIAAGIFPPEQLIDVQSEDTTDIEGNDALRITLVLSDDAAHSLTGKQLSSLLTEIHDTLLNKGDERFPMLRFETPDDHGNEEDDEASA